MENRKPVDQKAAAVCQRVLNLIAANPGVLAEQGAVVEGWREFRGRRLGPYFRLAFRVDGRQRSIYLGADRDLASAIRGLLADLQMPRHKRQALARLRKLTKKSMTRHKKQLRKELAKRGLYLKGHEIRGVRGLTHRCSHQ